MRSYSELLGRIMRMLYKHTKNSYLSLFILFSHAIAVLLVTTANAADDNYASPMRELSKENIQECVAAINQQADDALNASQRFYDTAVCYLCSGCDVTSSFGEGFQSGSESGISVSSENYEITYKLLKQSAELGNSSANYALALVLYLSSSIDGSLSKDKIYMNEYNKLKDTDEYKKFLVENNSKAILEREKKLENDVFLKKHELDYSAEISIRLLLAAQQGHIPSQFALGEVYSRGIGVAPDKVQAYAWSATAVAQDPPFGSSRRDQLASNMDAFELNEAESLAESYMKQYTSIFDRSSVTVMR